MKMRKATKEEAAALEREVRTRHRGKVRMAVNPRTEYGREAEGNTM